MEGVLALLITLVVAVIPALLFLVLWHGLAYLRDDELLARMRDEGNSEVPTYEPRFLKVRDRDAASPAAATSSGVHCPRCGTSNRPGMDYCQECLNELPTASP